MIKATHSGTCQVCGRLQKLPEGVLAKHGYNLRFGFFNGVCWGAGYRPFEQATDAIEKAIGWATGQRVALEAEIVKLSSLPVENTAPFHRYVTAKRQGERSGYREEQVTIILKGEQKFIQFTDGTIEPALRYSFYGTVSVIVLELRTRRIARCAMAIQEHQKYIDWQTNRVATWKPGKLQEVK